MKNNRNVFWVIAIFCVINCCILFSSQPLTWAEETVGVKIMSKELVGAFLADGNGMSLYSFARDAKNTSTCIEGCAVNWPPFYADPTTAGEGLELKDFAVITRTDGRQQSTYKGMPLYYFKNDKYPGDTFGQGLGDVWFLVTP